MDVRVLLPVSQRLGRSSESSQRYEMPRVAAPPLGVRLRLAALRQHDLVDKVDDGRGRLFGVELGKHVANILRQAARLLGHEPEHPEGDEREEDGEEPRRRGTRSRSVESRICLLGEAMPPQVM